jgi:hypothetical protein
MIAKSFALPDKKARNDLERRPGKAKPSHRPKAKIVKVHKIAAAVQ